MALITKSKNLKGLWHSDILWKGCRTQAVFKMMNRWFHCCFLIYCSSNLGLQLLDTGAESHLKTAHSAIFQVFPISQTSSFDISKTRGPILTTDISIFIESLAFLMSDKMHTVKPLYSRHHRGLEKCPLLGGLTFFSKEMTLRFSSSQYTRTKLSAKKNVRRNQWKHP